MLCLAHALVGACLCLIEDTLDVHIAETLNSQLDLG